jgi:hypothetical protein
MKIQDPFETSDRILTFSEDEPIPFVGLLVLHQFQTRMENKAFY